MEDIRAILDEIQQDLTGEADGLAKLERADAVLAELPVGSDDWLSFKTAIANIFGRLPGRNRAEYLEKAITTYQEVLTYRDREKDASDWARTQHNLGTAWRDRIKGNLSENRESALECYQQALTAYQFKRDRFAWGAVHNSIGNVFSVRVAGDPHENYELAIKHLGLALRAFTPEFAARQHARTKANLARLYFLRPTGSKTANLERAIRHGREGLHAMASLPGNFDHVNLHMVLASAYKQRQKGNRGRNFQKVLDHYQRAERILDPSQQPGEWARLTFNWALAERENPNGDSRDNMARASERLRACIEVWTPQAFPDLWIKAQQALCNTQAKIEEWKEVVRIADEVIAEARHRLVDIDDLYERRRLLASVGPVKNLKVLAMARTSGAVAALSALREHRAELLGRSYGNFLSDEATGKIQLSADTAKLYFCVQPLEGEPTLVYLLTKIDGKPRLEMFNLPRLSNRDMERLFERNPSNPELTWMAGYERFKNDNDLRAFMKAMDHVTNDLGERLQPLWERLSALPSIVAKLQVSASGALSVMPFAALPMGGKANLLVIDRFAISYETGLPIGADSAAMSAPCSKLMAVVDPRENLKFAQLEAEMVTGYFATAHTCSGTDATKANVGQAISGLGENTHLHFICHGQYAWRHPEVSHLELADDDTFSLAEIAEQLKLPLGASVTLSACETGINEFKALPEESYGFPMAFLAAGATSVLSPLWPVSDFMTAQLMGEYYRALQTGRSKPEALRLAQLAVRDRTENSPAAVEASQSIRWGRKTQKNENGGDQKVDLRHPYFWAGFVLFQ